MRSHLDICRQLHRVLAERVLSRKTFKREGLIPDLRAFTASAHTTDFTEEQFSYGALLASVTELEYRSFTKNMIDSMAESLPIIKRAGSTSLHRPTGSLLAEQISNLIDSVQNPVQPLASNLPVNPQSNPSATEDSDKVSPGSGTDEPVTKLLPASKLLPPTHPLNTAFQVGNAGPSGADDDAFSSTRKKENDRRSKQAVTQDTLAKQLVSEGILVELNANIYNSKKLIGMRSALIELETSILVPVAHPHLYTKGLSLNRGILLYGPPGSGKTFLCKCVAASAQVSCFVVTASHIMSKWQGESEKLVSSLFHLAREKAPSIILIDEIDGLLSQRSGDDSDGIRRVKNQFLQNLDEIKHHNDEQILRFMSKSSTFHESSSQGRSEEAPGRIGFVIILGATNFPEAIDQAAFRRFDKRIFVGLPDVDDREQFLFHNLPKHLIEEEPDLPRHIADRTVNFSNADLELLCESIKNCATRKLVEANYFIKDSKGEWIICEHGHDILTVDTPENKALRPHLFQGRLSQLPKGKCVLPRTTIKDALDILRSTFPSVTEEDMQKYKDFAAKFKCV